MGMLDIDPFFKFEPLVTDQIFFPTNLSDIASEFPNVAIVEQNRDTASFFAGRAASHMHVKYIPAGNDVDKFTTGFKFGLREQQEGKVIL